MTAALEAPAARPATLTGPHADRDRTVLELTACGLTRAQKARHLDVTPSAIDASIKRIKAAYGAPNTAGAMARALACGDLILTSRPGPPLTSRQRLMCALIAEGLSNRQIAKRADRRVSSVEDLLWRLMLILGAAGRTHAVCEAVRCSVLVASADGRSLVLAGGEP